MSTLSEVIAKRKAAAPVQINPPDSAPPAPYTPYVPKPEKLTTEETKWAEQSVAQAQERVVLPPNPEFTLYVDTSSKRHKDVVDLSSLISELTPRILDSLRKRSPSDVPEDAVDLREVKFGAGTQALCAYFKRNPPIGPVYASSIGLSGLVVEVLAPMAADVIRPTR